MSPKHLALCVHIYIYVLQEMESSFDRNRSCCACRQELVEPALQPVVSQDAAKQPLLLTG